MLITVMFFLWAGVILAVATWSLHFDQRFWPGFMGFGLAIVYIVMGCISTPPAPACTKTEVQKVLDCQDKGNGHMICRDATEEVCIAYSKDEP